MTKTDLVNFIAEEAGLTKTDAAKALDAFMAGVTKGLKEDGKVVITGFCTFTAKHKDAKKGRNPRTGETLDIPARTAVTVKTGSKLKEALN
jgi:DNA-binding protein HU-beta